MNKFFIYESPCLNKYFFHDNVFSCVLVSFPKYQKIDGNDEKRSRFFWKFSFVLATQTNSKSDEDVSQKTEPEWFDETSAVKADI